MVVAALARQCVSHDYDFPTAQAGEDIVEMLFINVLNDLLAQNEINVAMNGGFREIVHEGRVNCVPDVLAKAVHCDNAHALPVEKVCRIAGAAPYVQGGSDSEAGYDVPQYRRAVCKGIAVLDISAKVLVIR
ncbi:hypothetical protein BTE54_20300 [Agrobacterium sp. YIC 4121]|nr:hypothetical protein BTE54_20300 [Agrobacterium sp. YIC 4121]